MSKIAFPVVANFASRRLLSCAALLLWCVSLSLAQTPTTGALTGTVTDPSGAVIAGATVNLAFTATGQQRTMKTDASGSYTFALLPPGNYTVKFSAKGFRTTEASVTVAVTETPVLNQKLEVGRPTEVILVQGLREELQTQSSANGGVVGSAEITSLPLVSRNYTQIMDLSPGVVSNVSPASAVGNGTMDVSANGSNANENNYLMDGASIVNYVSGTAEQEGSFPGIAIPNPDSIEEFKVQTSQYDASAGRNPGANVTVVTKSGTNKFHGALWEFNRNNFYNGNDYFYKEYELVNGLPNRPQTLKQNTFGFTFGGPIKKDKLFFFGSYQGIRQVNGIGTSGFATGYESATDLMPWNDYADKASGTCSDLRCTNNVPAYKAYLGNLFAGQTGFIPAFGGTGVTIEPCTEGDTTCNSTNITNTAVGMLQLKGAVQGGYNGGFYFPSAGPSCTSPSGCTAAISDPTYARENQFMINMDYILSPKNTLSEKYFLSMDPQAQSFSCFILANNCNPGAPVDADYVNHVAMLKLTSVLKSNLVNEARVSFHRDIEDNTDPNNVPACDMPNGATIIPLENDGQPCPAVSTIPEMNNVPLLDIVNASGTSEWSQGGNFSMISTNFVDTFQLGDQVSWNHGKHSLRAGFEGERIYYNNTIPAAARGELIMYGTPDFLTSSAGPTIDGTPVTPTGGIAGGFGLGGTLTHYNRVNALDWYVQDDFKVQRNLILNLGLRWEYDGWPSDASGEFTDTWYSQAEKYNTGSAFLANPQGTLTGFVVPSNFDRKFGFTAPNGATGVLVNSNNSLFPGTPLKNFAPRVGVAWQPMGSKFVLRAGYGYFYDRVYGNLLVDNQLNLPPYAYTAFGPSPQNYENTLHDPWEAGAVSPSPLVWTPRYITSSGPGQYTSSGLTYTSDSPQMASRLPLTQEYSFDFQYEVAHAWIVDIGYVGSHSIHLYNWSYDANVAHLVANAPNAPSDPQNAAMIASSLPFNDPSNSNPVTVNTIGPFFDTSTFTLNNGTLNERVSYLGFAPGGMATTDTLGDGRYTSLQAQLRHLFAHGLYIQASYTLSRNMTDVATSEAGTGINPPGQDLFGASNSNDPLNLAQQYGPSDFNRSQRFTIAYSYDLPWKATNGWYSKVLGSWTLSGVTLVQNGEPLTITDGYGGTIYGTGSRAELANPVNCNSLGVCQSGVPVATTSNRIHGSWINPAAFVPATYVPSEFAFVAGTPCIGGITPGSCVPGENGAGAGYGNSPVGIMTGPGQYNWDMALQKGIKVKEAMRMLFRVEAFNLGNHPQFIEPENNDATSQATYCLGGSCSPSFGKITATSTSPRVLQFGAKYIF